MQEIIKREKYFSKITPYISKDIIKVLVWQRRVGKSKLLLQVIDYLKNDLKINTDKIIYIDKESISWDHIKDYLSLYENVKNYNHIFIDEIQNISDWEKAVVSLQNEWKDVYITWSNSNILSWNLATNLRWRFVQIEVFPLSFLEFLEFHNLENSMNSFYKYITFWWLPYLANLELKNEIVYDYLKNISDTIVLRDIIERFAIRSVSFFHNLLKFSALNIWSIFSSTNISAFLKNQNQKISPTTILDYIDYLKQAYVINECPRYDIKWKKVFEIRQKYFYTDIWIRNVIVWWYRKSDISGILENIVFMTLKSNGWNIRIWEINNLEVDFVAEKNAQIIYIQVAYIIEWNETLKRELASLEAIKDNWPKYLITTDIYEKNEKINGINLQNVKDFIINIEKNLI